jgi:hypothetical protein
MAVEKLKRYKSPGSEKIRAVLIQVVGRAVCSEYHKLINSIWNREEFSQQWKESVFVSTLSIKETKGL